jgi:hypothetical protein
MKKNLARIAAWLVTLGLLGYLVTTVKPADVAHAIKAAPGWTLPVLAGLVVLVFLADSLAIWRTFGWFLARLSFGEVLIVRGATYILALVNYALGQGAIVYFVHRSRGTPVLRGTAAVLLIMGINLLMLLILASLGLGLAPEVPAFLKTVVIAGYAGLAVYLTLLVIKPRWLSTRPVFDVLLTAGLGGHVKALLVRVPHILSLVLLTYTSLRAFGIAVPLKQALLFLPIVYFVGVLPISFQGWGTTQFVMVHFFARYATGADPRAVVFASSVTTQVVALVVQAAIGLLCLRNQLARDISKMPATTASASVSVST